MVSNLIDKEWRAYAAAVYNDPRNTPEILAHLRQAFFAGAISVWNVLGELVDDPVTVQAIHAEIVRTLLSYTKERERVH